MKNIRDFTHIEGHISCASLKLAALNNNLYCRHATVEEVECGMPSLWVHEQVVLSADVKHAWEAFNAMSNAEARCLDVFLSAGETGSPCAFIISENAAFHAGRGARRFFKTASITNEALVKMSFGMIDGEAPTDEKQRLIDSFLAGVEEMSQQLKCG